MRLAIEEATEWIHSRLPFGSRPDLDRINALLEKIDHPENRVPTIHIIGTNGKGSTVAYLRCLSEEMGSKVKTFTPLYIESFNERIAINGQPISDEQLITYVEKYQPIIKELDQATKMVGITKFETLIGMVLDYLANEQVDIAVVEVGLGGLPNSTNVVKPLLTRITTVGRDHTEVLDETITETTCWKAGIIKEKVLVAIGDICADALAVIEKVTQEKQSLIFRFGKEHQVECLHPDVQWGEVFGFYGEMGKLTKTKVPLLGHHQVGNVAVAIQLFDKYCQLQHLPFKERDITQGLVRAQWPARMERLGDGLSIVLDGTHNDHAVRHLVENLCKELPQHMIHTLSSALATKSVDEMIQDLKQVPNAHLYLTSFDYPKTIASTEVEKCEDDLIEVMSLWQFDLGEILEKVSTDDLLLVIDSLYFVSQVRELLLTVGGNDEEI